ncbi:MAG: hypothetical protein JO272_13925 [Pseudonocardiales bacterium]|nr:hypothetical protein [Pseudonocardiales bacterium]
MPDPLAPLWRDPLFSPGDRFPLRHVVAGARLDQAPTLRWTYCPQRQVAMVYDEDGSLVPYAESRTRLEVTPEQTTGYIGGPDGAGPGEEEVMDPDYQAD